MRNIKPELSETDKRIGELTSKLKELTDQVQKFQNKRDTDDSQGQSSGQMYTNQRDRHSNRRGKPKIRGGGAGAYGNLRYGPRTYSKQGNEAELNLRTEIRQMNKGPSRHQ